MATHVQNSKKYAICHLNKKICGDFCSFLNLHGVSSISFCSRLRTGSSWREHAGTWSLKCRFLLFFLVRLLFWGLMKDMFEMSPHSVTSLLKETWRIKDPSFPIFCFVLCARLIDKRLRSWHFCWRFGRQTDWLLVDVWQTSQIRSFKVAT